MNLTLRSNEIFVNTVKHEWGATIRYVDLLDLAGVDKSFTVQYSRGPADNREGTMVLGDTVKLKTGMVFDATWTGNT